MWRQEKYVKGIWLIFGFVGLSNICYTIKYEII